jgi:hypothetical protein
MIKLRLQLPDDNPIKKAILFYFQKLSHDPPVSLSYPYLLDTV